MVKRKESEKNIQNESKITKPDLTGDEEPNFSDDEGYVDDISEDGKAIFFILYFSTYSGFTALLF